MQENANILREHVTRYLVPFAGMFNHANSGVRRDSSSGAAFTLTHQITSDNRFVVRSDRDTNVNQEIFEDYGVRVKGSR